MSTRASSLTFACDYGNCSKVFGTKYNLKRHIESCHLLLKNFTCDFCGLKLVSKQNKQEHMFIHTGEKPFKCDVPECTKQYRQSSQLSIHRKKHWKKLQESLKLPTVNHGRRLSQRDVKLPLPQPLRDLIQ